jgi:hypothetical protein
VTNEQINRAIAEACGWEADYCGDLNAMREAEKGLGNRLREYGERLCEMTVVSEQDFPACYIWHATARQRAEAFLRALGKWEEVQR